MLTLHISETDIEVLKYERYTYPCRIVQRRMHVLYIKSQTNLTNSVIAQIVGLHRDTVTDYVKKYNQGGLACIYKVGYGTNESKIEAYSQSLLSYFESHPPHTINEAREKIKELTGIQRSPTQIRLWLKRHGLRYRKAGQIPGKVDKVKQAEYVQAVLNPLIERAQAEEIHLLFMDAAHFVMGVFLCCLWSAKRVFIKSSSGRKRYNVLGAVDAITKQVHTWTNESYINSNSIADFFHQLRIYYYDMKPIYIILDNARYQKCQFVKYIAWQFNIQLIYLPPYSPNLNLIERLWKWVKKQTLYATYYEDFSQFKKAIDNSIYLANNNRKHEIQTLLNLKFQLF